MLLAIDTSAGTSVAIVDRDGGVLAERGSADTRRHSEQIGVMIADVLAESGVAVSALSGVAIGMGPGPFTGLRVGIAAGQAFALGATKPVVRVVSHDAIAAERYASGASGPLQIVTDARRREVYVSEFSGLDPQGLPVRTAGPALMTPADVPSHTHRVDADVVSAGALGMLAEHLFEHGRPFAGREPLYLRAPDVTISTGPKRVT